MLTRLLSTVVALAFLLFGATIAMEAMGLIFRPAPADPRLRMDAAIPPQIEASLDPRNVPSEAEAEGLWPPPEEHSRKPKQAAAARGGEPPSAVAAGTAWTVVVETEPERSHRGPGG